MCCSSNNNCGSPSDAHHESIESFTATLKSIVPNDFHLPLRKHHENTKPGRPSNIRKLLRLREKKLRFRSQTRRWQGVTHCLPVFWWFCFKIIPKYSYNRQCQFQTRVCITVGIFGTSRHFIWWLHCVLLFTERKKHNSSLLMFPQFQDDDTP